jgi:hypothetical protein
MEGKGIYMRRWSWMAELTVVLATVLGGAMVAVTEKPDDSDDSSSPWRRDTRPLWFTPSVLFSSFSPFASLGLSVDILGFQFRLLRFLLSQHYRFLSLGFPPCFLSFFPVFPPCVRVVLIGAGGAGSSLPRPIAACMWFTLPPLPRRRAWWPMEALLAEHGCSGIS